MQLRHQKHAIEIIYGKNCFATEKLSSKRCMKSIYYDT